jgi:5-methylcytosine-specific restriction protein A
MDLYFQASSIEHQKREKVKAQKLRASQWWKNQLGRGLCYHCEGRFHPSLLTMDHLLPIARGGLSEKNNVVTSCKECNTKKGYKTRAEIAMEELNHNTPKLTRVVQI